MTSVREAFPQFVVELVTLVEASCRPELAEQIPALEVVDRCRCGDRNCAHFYTAPRPAGAYPEGHANVRLGARRGFIGHTDTPLPPEPVSEDLFLPGEYE